MKRPQEDGADFAEEKREADGQNDKTDSNEVTEDNTKFTANDESEGDESDSDFYDGFIDQEELDMCKYTCSLLSVWRKQEYVLPVMLLRKRH